MFGSGTTGQLVEEKMLAQKIKIFRKKYNLSQEELAQKAGITYSTLIKIESGVNDNPTIKTVIKIAEALDVTIDRLIIDNQS